ncbi:AfsR/SARP family transcriptional regulator [Streptomyces sp. NPDC002491]
MSPNAAFLELLGVFEFTYAENRLTLPSGAQRLLALLALNPDGIYRGAAAEALWPDCPPARAAANLRTALCQGRRACALTAIDSIGHRLRLAASVTVDLQCAWAKAKETIAGLSQPPLDCEAYIGDLTRQLLPGWPDEWLIPERERWGQLRQHALESLALQCRAAGQYLAAIQSATAAIAVDPIRENAHRILIEIHADEGNIACALMRYRHYETLLQQELGVAPSGQMARLTEDLISQSAGQRRTASNDTATFDAAAHTRALKHDVRPAGARASQRAQPTRGQRDIDRQQSRRGS